MVYGFELLVSNWSYMLKVDRHDKSPFTVSTSVILYGMDIPTRPAKISSTSTCFFQKRIYLSYIKGGITWCHICIYIYNILSSTIWTWFCYFKPFINTIRMKHSLHFNITLHTLRKTNALKSQLLVTSGESAYKLTVWRAARRWVGGSQKESP